jgi:hypothetical protein
MKYSGILSSLFILAFSSSCQASFLNTLNPKTAAIASLGAQILAPPPQVGAPPNPLLGLAGGVLQAAANQQLQQQPVGGFPPQPVNQFGNVPQPNTFGAPPLQNTYVAPPPPQNTFGAPPPNTYGAPTVNTFAPPVYGQPQQILR